MTKIVSVEGRKILDSRGNPTVRVNVGPDDGTLATSRGRAAPVLFDSQALFNCAPKAGPRLAPPEERAADTPID
jgi:hypothetical protein